MCVPSCVSCSLRWVRTCRVDTTTFLLHVTEAAATPEAVVPRARSMQARADASEGAMSLLSALGLPLGDGSCELVDLIGDGLMATLGMRPPSPALLDARLARAGGRKAENHSPSRHAWRA
jgi:hypothetical protein